MKNFSYHNPTRIEFGTGKEENVGQYISEYGISKVLIVYGSERIKKNGLFDKVAKLLTDNGISFEALGGVQSNPLLSKVYEGIEIAKKYGLEFLYRDFRVGFRDGQTKSSGISRSNSGSEKQNYVL